MATDEEYDTSPDVIIEEEEDEAPARPFPDYFYDANAVLRDEDADWRFGRQPDYTKTRNYWRETKQANHKAESLEELVENVVKNWEIEASYKPNPKQWRTIDTSVYQFRINGGDPQPASVMSKVGTYNALIPANNYYDPERMDFSASHKTFKRMMPVFAWELLHVFTGPPKVVFQWRHWGSFQNDYSAVNVKGEKVNIKATGEIIDVKGMTIAELNDKGQITSIDVYFDPMDMFRQIGVNPTEGSAELDALKEAAAQCPAMSAQKEAPSSTPSRRPRPRVLS